MGHPRTGRWCLFPEGASVRRGWGYDSSLPRVVTSPQLNCSLRGTVVDIILSGMVSREEEVKRMRVLLTSGRIVELKDVTDRHLRAIQILVHTDPDYELAIEGETRETVKAGEIAAVLGADGKRINGRDDDTVAFIRRARFGDGNRK